MQNNLKKYSKKKKKVSKIESINEWERRNKSPVQNFKQFMQIFCSQGGGAQLSTP